jgi:hypothetical protein
LAFVHNKLFLSLYESYKDIKEERQAKKWANYEIEVIGGVKGILENFKIVDEKNSKSKKPLRLSKNGKKIIYDKNCGQRQKRESARSSSKIRCSER